MCVFHSVERTCVDSGVVCRTAVMVYWCILARSTNARVFGLLVMISVLPVMWNICIKFIAANEIY